MSGITVVTAPTLEPVSISEVKADCRYASSDKDAEFAMWIFSARQYVERYTGRLLMTQTVDFSLDEFDDCMNLEVAPIQSITSVSYTDTAGDSQTFADYQSDLISDLPRIMPAYGYTWPSTESSFNAVTIRMVVGYGSNPGDVPHPIRQAIKLLVKASFDEDPSLQEQRRMAADALIHPYRIYQ